MIVYSYSPLSLILLFGFFISIAGMALNQIYMSSFDENERTDSNLSQQIPDEYRTNSDETVLAQKQQNLQHQQNFNLSSDQNNPQIEDNLEFVSVDTVQSIIVMVYQVILRLQQFTQDVTSLKDIRLTLKIILTCLTIMLLTFFISDATFLWIVSNAVMLYPLAYNKKQQLIENIWNRIDSFVNSIVNKSSFLKKIEINYTNKKDQ
eukprot:403358010